MSTLALDLGTHTGWAVRVNPNSTFSGTINLKGGRFEGGGRRFIRFNAFLKDLHDEGYIDEVYFEEVRRHMGADAAHIYGGLLAVLASFCEQFEIPYEGIPVGTIKKYATGKGNADKDEMLAAAKIKFPRQNIEDDNQADALWILATALKL